MTPWRSYQLHPNDWYVRTARRLLQERAVAGKDLGAAHRVARARSSRPIRKSPAGCGALGAARHRRPG